MLYWCAGRALKQPVEINMSEEEFEKIQKLTSSDRQNAEIAGLALQHIKKYGYDLGRCSNRGNVDYNKCINCATQKGIGKKDWDLCRDKNINYKYPTSKITANAIKEIKDEKIKKMIELTPEELNMSKNLFITEK